MNEFTDNTAQGGNSTQQGGTRTFSQDDVNRIVSERLSKEKAKNEAEHVKKEQELAQRELVLTAKELLSNKDLPPELYEAINCSSKEVLERSIDIIHTAFSKRRPFKMKGAVPGESGREDGDEAVDNAHIRKAMGLS